MTSYHGVAMLALGAALAWPALAQSQSLITLNQERPARWDVSVHSGRQGLNRRDVPAGWDSWYEAPHLTGSVGFYWTPNLKIEVDLARSAAASLFVPQTYQVPGQPWPYTRGREHRLSTLGAAAGVHYQFFDNRWFHPFVGAGVEVVRERARADAQPAMSEVRGSIGIIVPALPALPALAVTSTMARPFAGVGFKAYLSPSAFLRTDLHTAMSGRGLETVTWRAGAGVDF